LNKTNTLKNTQSHGEDTLTKIGQEKEILPSRTNDGILLTR